jgi:DNA-binding PadR family transcriptional regulator
LLGLLHDRPLYGYEIKQIIEGQMGDWTSIAFGSIYFALDKLSEEQFVEKIAVEQSGGWPSRSVYPITPAGETEFIGLLRGGWKNVERQYFEQDVCLFFLHRLPVEEINTCLQARILRLETALKYLNEHEAAQMNDPEIHAQARAIFDHSRVHIASELARTQGLAKELF